MNSTTSPQECCDGFIERLHFFLDPRIHPAKRDRVCVSALICLTLPRQPVHINTAPLRKTAAHSHPTASTHRHVSTQDCVKV